MLHCILLATTGTMKSATKLGKQQLVAAEVSIRKHTSRSISNLLHAAFLMLSLQAQSVMV